MLDQATSRDDPGLSPAEMDDHLLAVSDRLDPSAIRDIVAGHLASGGDRARARLTYRTCRCAGLGHASAMALAACVEALHQASLVHDDLTDRSALRRGRPAVWAEHGEAVALAVGDHLISLAYACLADAAEVDPREGLVLVHRAVSATIRGQCADLQSDSPAGASDSGAGGGAGVLADWSRVAALKAGPLLALGPDLAMTARDDGAEARAMLRAACLRLAIGYQILDDCRDIAQDRSAERPEANLCLRFEASGLTAAEAADTALLHAECALRRAARDASAVPDGLGAPVARLCRTKLHETEALVDAL
ncbi:polyprenyl synthetase family protein [Rhodosalinus sp.]|uniref:polyprenyl synthetase family protein n=1 Tax=Rhodosalinus sp. TaxID=2047741 RepID=UPI00397AB703